MPVKYENGKKVHLPYPKKKNKNKNYALDRSSKKYRTVAEAAEALDKKPLKPTQLRQGKGGHADAISKIFKTVVADPSDPVDVSLAAAGGPIGKTIGTFAKLSKAIGAGASKMLFGVPLGGIITPKGQKKWRKANEAFNKGEGQPKVRQSIEDMRGIFKKYPERFDEKKTGFSTDTIDEMAAHAVLNAKNKASGYRGKKYGKRFLAEAYEALRNKYNISKVDIHQTNRELSKTLEGTAGVRQAERTFDKAREGTFNPPHTSDLKRIWRKKKREDKKKGEE